jgi:hypothetical protein
MRTKRGPGGDRRIRLRRGATAAERDGTDVAGEASVGEDGSVSVLLVTSATAMIILLGLAVDLSGQVLTQQHARDVAAQAARAAGQQLQGARVVRGQGVEVDVARAAAAGRAYLAGSDVAGTVAVSGGTTVVVTTTAVYETSVLGIVGIDRLTVTGSARARTVRSVDGVDR